MKKHLRILSAAVIIAVFSAGCGPTYPKEKFEDSILRICRDEYKLEVRVTTLGKTIAIYLPLEDLIDPTFAISQKASEKINDVILSVSRVALSTNANFDFYCIIAHDVRIPEVQIVIIKSVDDVKRFLLNDISRSEYSKRMLIDIRVNPQSQKETAIKEVFDKMNLDKKWQDQVMGDFFRSEPAALGDIGYWGGRFYIKDVSMSEFLAEQIANRIRMEFREDKPLLGNFNLKYVKGTYISEEGKKVFKINISADPKWFGSASAAAHPDDIFRAAVNVIRTVLRGYRFEDFDYVDIIYETDNKFLELSKDELEMLRTKKLKLEEVLNKTRSAISNI